MKRSVNIVIKGPLFFLASFFFFFFFFLLSAFKQFWPSQSYSYFFKRNLFSFGCFQDFLFVFGFQKLHLVKPHWFSLCFFVGGFWWDSQRYLNLTWCLPLILEKSRHYLFLNIASAHHLFTPLTTITSIYCTSVADTPFLFVSFYYSCLILGIFSWTLF